MTDEFEPTLRAYQDLLFEWNGKVNLVSRRLEHADLWDHIQHCLAIVADRSFPAGARVVDWGTGGGLPAIPLAIVQPHVTITAVDSTLKKVNAVNDMAHALGLTNVHAEHARAESWRGQIEYSVSRATAPLVKLWAWHRRATRSAGRRAAKQQTAEQQANEQEATAQEATAQEATAQEAANIGLGSEHWPRGLIALKGGDLADEISTLTNQFPHTDVSQHRLDGTLGAGYDDKCLVFVRKARSQE